MNRKFGIGILAFCFSLSGVNAGLAAQAIEISPIIVQPYDLREISQQEAVLGKIDQTMVHYRQEVSKYHDLIALTEKVDDMKGFGLSRVQSKGPSNPAGSIALPPIIVNTPNNQQQAASDEQAEAMALRNKMRRQGLDDAIRWLNQVVVVSKEKAEYYRLTSQQDHLTMEKVQEEVRQTVARLGARLSQKQQQVDLLKSELENQITSNDQAQMEKQTAYLNAQLQEKEAQVVKIKKEMYDLQELMNAKDRDLQAKNLSLSIELALARQKLNGIPGSDEDDRLREKLKQALDEIAEQGRTINVLVRKLQDAGKSVDNV